MTQEYRDFNEMLAHIRHKDVEVKHKAVKADTVKKTAKKKKKEDK